MSNTGKRNRTSKDENRQSGIHSDAPSHRMERQPEQEDSRTLGGCGRLIQGSKNTADDEIDKEHWYNPNGCPLFQAKIAAFVVTSCAEIQLIILQGIIAYHVNHFFPVFCQQVGAAFEDTFASGLLQNNESISLGPNAAVAKAVDETRRGKQADYAILRAASLTLE